jgi:hypothetical protein
MASHHQAMPLRQALIRSCAEEGGVRAVPAGPNCWHDTPAATALLEKIDAFERLSDHWCGDVAEAARAFTDAAQEAESELDNLRRAAVVAAADAVSDDIASDEWLDAWADADCDAESVSDVCQRARRLHAGDAYLNARGCA